jgi:hypothetical protein
MQRSAPCDGLANLDRNTITRSGVCNVPVGIDTLSIPPTDMGVT